MANIIHSIQIAASAEAVFPLVSTAEGLARWWAADVSEPEGAVELGFFNRQTVYRLRPQVHRTPHRAEWLCETGEEWTHTRLIFELEPRAAATLVRFTHADWRSASDYFISCNTVWGELMFRLRSEAEGKARGPLFLRESQAY
jgi:uncharacterized protein YndB with AHSA1/START domain